MERYSGVAMGLHWGMALLIIGLLAVGLWMVELPPEPFKFWVYGWHKTLGLLVIGLVVGRIVWRMLFTPPALPAATPRWQLWAAAGTHFLLYILMLAMPVTGWVMSDAAGYSPKFFGWPVPMLWGKDSVVAGWANFLHELSGKVLIGLIVLHVAAALYHHLIIRDGGLLRMVPRWVRLPRPKVW